MIVQFAAICRRVDSTFVHISRWKAQKLSQAHMSVGRWRRFQALKWLKILVIFLRLWSLSLRGMLFNIKLTFFMMEKFSVVKSTRMTTLCRWTASGNIKISFSPLRVSEMSKKGLAWYQDIKNVPKNCYNAFCRAWRERWVAEAKAAVGCRRVSWDEPTPFWWDSSKREWEKGRGRLCVIRWVWELFMNVGEMRIMLNIVNIVNGRRALIQQHKKDDSHYSKRFIFISHLLSQFWIFLVLFFI